MVMKLSYLSIRKKMEKLYDLKNKQSFILGLANKDNDLFIFCYVPIKYVDPILS